MVVKTKISTKAFKEFQDTKEKRILERRDKFMQFIKSLPEDTSEEDIHKYYEMYRDWDYIFDINVKDIKESWEQ